MPFIFWCFYWYLLACLLALAEVQIEGPHGWAEKLPTWRPGDSHWYGRWFAKLMGGKPATGYHAVMFTLVLAILHYPAIIVGPGWSWTEEGWTLSVFFLLVVTWDFLWFILNPHFRLHKFLPHHIWWHKKWWWKMPADYFIGLAISGVLAWLAGGILAWCLVVIIFILFTLLLVGVTHDGIRT